MKNITVKKIMCNINENGSIIMHYVRKIILDTFLFSFSYIFSFLIRFDFSVPPFYLKLLILSLPIVILIRISTFFSLKIYNNDYNYFSIPNVFSILKALFLSSILISIIFLTFPKFFRCPKSVLIIDWLLVFVSICGARFLIKSLRQGILKTLKKAKNGKHVLILGAGDAAESILREIKCYNHYNYFPVGLIDDDPQKQGKIIQGVKVLGNSQSIPQIVNNKKIEALIIAIPSATRKQLTSILQNCEELKLKILSVPSLYEITEEKLLINQLREVKPENILFRKQIEWDNKDLFNEINGKRVMVTGAGGSIGSELCRQILKYKPEELILFERSEYNLFCIDDELKRIFPYQSFRSIIADMADYNLTLKVTKTYRPDIIFHTAAYKHVFLMEINPEVAIKNNVIGTMNIVQAAIDTHVPKLILISSDKAVNPTSIMGATKRICEEYIKAISKAKDNYFFGVRFGNVLGSSGSVLQIFKNQIAHGGPVTVTHANVSRYFMTIAEAVHLVLQTITFAKGSEIFILDMGKPVRIYDLAKKFIQMSGLKPYDDIEIIFTGLKPGEKLTEELFEKNEKLEFTPHKKILKIKNNNNTIDLAQFNHDAAELLAYASEMNRIALINKIKQMIPTFQSSLSDISFDFARMEAFN